jgi:hypothetical protein
MKAIIGKTLIVIDRSDFGVAGYIAALRGPVLS